LNPKRVGRVSVFLFGHVSDEMRELRQLWSVVGIYKARYIMSRGGRQRKFRVP
jgi:hypothetical protein